MLSAPLPATASLTVAAACAALHAHGCTDAEVFRALGHRATIRTLRARLCEARATARLAERGTAPSARQPVGTARPTQRLKPSERAELRAALKRMGPGGRATFQRLLPSHPALRAAALAMAGAGRIGGAP